MESGSQSAGSQTWSVSEYEYGSESNGSLIESEKRVGVDPDTDSDPNAQRFLCNSKLVMLFWKRMYNSGNSLLNSLSAICYGNMTSLAAKYV